MILLNYIMLRNRELGLLKGNEFVVKTIVTTETIKAIAENRTSRCSTATQVSNGLQP